MVNLAAYCLGTKITYLGMLPRNHHGERFRGQGFEPKILLSSGIILHIYGITGSWYRFFSGITSGVYLTWLVDRTCA